MNCKRIISFTTAVLLMTWISASASTSDNADALNYIGLLQGTDNGYELDKTLTRAEAITMVVRFLGAEKEAQSKEYTIPFDDVPDWAAPYVGYAYSNGITNGTDEGKFSPDNTISDNQYLTFLLRVLGYDDSKGDFGWETPYELAKQKGIISSSEKNETFLRGDMTDISWNALSAEYKDSTMTISEKLIGKKVFSAVQYTVAKSISKSGRETALKALPAKGGSSGGSSSSGGRGSAHRTYTEINEQYKVTFLDDDGTVLSEQNVNRGEDAVPPQSPKKNGYTFLGWSHPFYGIMGETQTKAKYAANDSENIFCISSANTKPGETFDVSLDIKGTVNVCAYDMTLVYDPDVLELDDYTVDPLLDIMSEHFADDGEIVFNMSRTRNITAKSNIMTLTFTVKDTDKKSTVIKLKPKEVVSADSNMDLVNCEYSVADGEVMIN